MVDISRAVYAFTPPDGSCHQYFLEAFNVDEAIKIFLRWQKEEYSEEERWPENVVKDSDNWSLDLTVHIIR